MKTKYMKPNVRKNWGEMSPVTKVVQSRKKYNRNDKSWKNGD